MITYAKTQTGTTFKLMKAKDCKMYGCYDYTREGVILPAFGTACAAILPWKELRITIKEFPSRKRFNMGRADLYMASKPDSFFEYCG